MQNLIENMIWTPLHHRHGTDTLKRVGVLKYFGATKIYANVIRVLPERNGSEEVERYYEFVDFYA